MKDKRLDRARDNGLQPRSRWEGLEEIPFDEHERLLFTTTPRRYLACWETNDKEERARARLKAQIQNLDSRLQELVDDIALVSKATKIHSFETPRLDTEPIIDDPFRDLEVRTGALTTQSSIIEPTSNLTKFGLAIGTLYNCLTLLSKGESNKLTRESAVLAGVMWGMEHDNEDRMNDLLAKTKDQLDARFERKREEFLLDMDREHRLPEVREYAAEKYDIQILDPVEEKLVDLNWGKQRHDGRESLDPDIDSQSGVRILEKREELIDKIVAETPIEDVEEIRQDLAADLEVITHTEIKKAKADAVLEALAKKSGMLTDSDVEFQEVGRATSKKINNDVAGGERSVSQLLNELSGLGSTGKQRTARQVVTRPSGWELTDYGKLLVYSYFRQDKDTAWAQAAVFEDTDIDKDAAEFLIEYAREANGE